MAIIKVKWTDGEDKHMIHMGGSIPQAILTVEDMSDGMLSECLRYAIKKKLSALHVVNGESFPFGADVVLDIGYNLKDILNTLDEIVRESEYYNCDIEVFKGKYEESKCSYLIRMDSTTLYELVGYDYD